MRNRFMGASYVVALVVALGPLSAPRAVADDVPDRRAAVKQRWRDARGALLAHELALDASTRARLEPVLARWDEVAAPLLRERAEIRRRLASENAKGAGTDATIDRALDVRRRLRDLEAARFTELRALLTPAQAARLLVLLPAVERRLLVGIRRSLREQGLAPTP